jgi:hypothetical protein
LPVKVTHLRPAVQDGLEFRVCVIDMYSIFTISGHAIMAKQGLGNLVDMAIKEGRDAVHRIFSEHFTRPDGKKPSGRLREHMAVLADSMEEEGLEFWAKTLRSG